MAKKFNTDNQDQWKNAYLEEKFNNIDEKLDDIKASLSTKATASSFSLLDARLTKVEDNHIGCPVMNVLKDVEKLKTDRDELMDITDDARYFKKHPNQFKMMIVGFLFVAIVSLVANLPGLFNWLSNRTIIPKEKETIEKINKVLNDTDGILFRGPKGYLPKDSISPLYGPGYGTPEIQ